MSGSEPAHGDEPVPPTTNITVAERAAERTENYLDAYGLVGEWIRFADAKAAVVLTVDGALASILLPTLGTLRTTSGPLATTGVVLFTIWAVLTVVSGLFAVWCVLPLRKRGEHPALGHCDRFHPAAISSRYRDDEVERFVADARDGGSEAFERQVLAGLLIDSHISAAKYARVATAIRALVVAAPFGFAYLLMLQFV
ncbi:MAG: hypothetical protein IPM29_22340 [Planctomycetes bacterium]|nr:hypothetical protein [Planctomycetota bacterium]